jgi:hypothetical protein
MKTKLPPNFIFHHDLRLMVLKGRGTLTRERVTEIVEFLDNEEERTQEPFNRFTDMSGIDGIELDLPFVYQIALHRRVTYVNRPPVKSAFYVTTPAAAQVVRVHAFVTKDSAIEVKMFTQLGAAAEWLGVSQETLETDITSS